MMEWVAMASKKAWASIPVIEVPCKGYRSHGMEGTEETLQPIEIGGHLYRFMGCPACFWAKINRMRAQRARIRR